MSDRVQKNRPRIYDNDTFAADVAAAMHGKAASLWYDVETFVDQLFAKTAGEEGFPYWAEALGIPLTYSLTQARRDGIRQWLLKGGTFNREHVEALIRRHIGSVSFTIEESVNWIDIYIPMTVSAAARYQLMTALLSEKPMHVGFSVQGRQSLG